MTKTEQIVVLLAAKNSVERKQEFYKILCRLMTNDLYALMGDEYDIQRVEKEKPHMKNVLNDLSYLLSYDQIKPRHSKEILGAAWESDEYQWDIGRYILDKKLFDEVSLDGIIDEVIAENEKAWGDFCAGKEKVMGRLIGSVMKKTKGKADPEEAQRLFREKI
jgi:Asp-tRNA(Asn)/Glu-tRNA(Gln) amidotransferase B subunit